MGVVRNAIALLQAVTAAIPPGPNQHHALMLPDDRPGLMLHIIRGGQFHTIVVDEEDLDRDIQDVVRDVLKLLQELPSAARSPLGTVGVELE